MSHAFVTIAIPFELQNEGAVDAVLDSLGNPATPPVRDMLREQGIHFTSMVVVPGPPRAHLLIEASADGTVDAALVTLATRLSGPLEQVFQAAGIERSPSLHDALKKGLVRTGSRLLDTAGLDFAGTPGMTVTRIRREAALARHIRDRLAANQYPGTALDILRAINLEIFADPERKSLLQPEPTALLASGPAHRTPWQVVMRGLCGVWQFGWPYLAPALAIVAVLTAIACIGSGIGHALVVLLVGLGVAVGIGVLLAAAIVVMFLSQEQADRPDNSMPDAKRLDEVQSYENRREVIQNHLAGVSEMKPGWLRKLSLRVAFWFIGFIAWLQFRPGYLGQIGTIHFARWFMLPGTNKLIFFSNYGGSWESYLEDFITLAHNGLTGVWSNTRGFPRARFLFGEGAKDGDRFKRWARRQQYSTRFWYCAYPDLGTDRIRTNAAIRHGLATARTEDEAQAWLSMFGSRLRPRTQIETEEVQTILFGGLKHHGNAVALLLRLPDEAARGRAWLSAITPDITFGDSAPEPTVQLVAFTASGLARLGMSAEHMTQFPHAFCQGMAHPVRSRILMDTGPDAPAHWLWGNDGNTVDAALLLYARNEADRQWLERDWMAQAQLHGLTLAHRVVLQHPTKAPAWPGHPDFPSEPFGFADGISQPIMRGTRRWLRHSDALHVVEPGEMIMGYPDNRGYLPLTPSIPPAADPADLLAATDPLHSRGAFADFDSVDPGALRDLGRNGTFVVLRQLEQHVDRFDRFLTEAAAQHANDPGVPPHMTQERLRLWLAAKMVGRWPDGTSLVRYPHRPGSGWPDEVQAEAAGGNGESPAAAAEPAPATPPKKRQPTPDNDFLPGAEDPGGERCPFGAHIRRANPRDSFQPSSMEEVAIVNRHRILRFGRSYRPGEGGDAGSPHPGLLFMCANADIERQFEFVQQTWVMPRQFMASDNEEDPLLTRGGRMGRITIPTACTPIQVAGIPDLVRMRGGGYFFMPGKRTLRWLAQVQRPLLTVAAAAE